MAGNARFHNKWHRRNHHSLPSTGYPDSANDPIASPDEPFQGDFHLTGTLSAHENLFVDGNASVMGNLSVFGDFTYLDTIVTVTSALSVINHGTGPALTVQQWGAQPIARFTDADAPGGPIDALYLDDKGYVIVDGNIPKTKYDPYVNAVSAMNLTVNGNAYASKAFIYERPDANTIYVSTTGSDLNSGLNPSQKVRTIKKAAKIAFDLYGPNKSFIHVEAGDYTEKNPIYLVAGTSIIGEAYLRRTTVRPYNRQLDLFWLNNGCYMWGFTFRDTLEPSASTAFPNLLSGTPAYKVAFQTPGYEIDVTKPGGPFGLPIVSKPYIVTSPYTQGMSTITSYMKVPIQPNLFPSYVEPDQQYTNLCAKSGYKTSAFVKRSFDIIASAVENGRSTLPPITASMTPVPGASDAVTLIAYNSSFIQTAVVNYVDETYPMLVYNKNLCYRDVGYILQSIVYDLTNNTNLCCVSAGYLYYNNANQSLVPGQQKQTANAIKFANTLTQSVIINKIYPWYEQRFDNSLTLGNQTTAGIAFSLNTISNIIRTGIIPSSPSSNPVDSTAAAQASALLVKNKPFIQKTTVQYVNKTFPGFTYNQELCERDAGFMIDSVIYDITNSTNASAIDSGKIYYRNGSSIIKGQELQTAAAVDYIKFLAQKVVTNTIAVTSQSFNPYLSSGYLASTYVKDSFEAIKKIIITGETPQNQQFDNSGSAGGAAATYVQGFFNTVASVISSKGTVPPLVTYGSIGGNTAAAALLTLNKPFIQRLTLEYVERYYPKLRFNKALCYRDMGYIVDAVVSDLTYQTNASSRYAGSKYYSGMTSYQLFTPSLSNGINSSYAVKKSLYTIVDTIKNYGLIPGLVSYPGGTGYSDAITLLANNKTFIQELTINFVNKNYPYLYYDRAKCYRDAGYMIDAVIYDLTNLTNASARSVASYYYYNCASTIKGQENATAAAVAYINDVAQKVIVNEQFPVPTNIVGQETPTVEAILYAANVASYVITNSAFPFYAQKFDYTKNGTDSSGYLTSAYTTVSGIITNGIGSINYPNFIPTPGALSAKDLLLLNKDFIKTEVVNFVNATFPTLNYNKALCFRDTGYIVDAVANDITNGNFLSSTYAGEKYYTGNGQYINNSYPNGSQASISVTTSLSTISQTIRSNGVVQPSYSYSVTPGFFDAITLLTNNKSYIQRLTVEYVDRTFTGFGKTFTYNRDKCYRDAGYMVDAVIYDLTNGSNASALYVASQYFVGAVNQIEGQETETAAAIDYINVLAQKIITNSRYTGITLVPGQQKQTADAIGYANRISQQIISNSPVSSRYDAATLLSMNKVFIQKETIQYVNRNYPSFTYNKDKCERDVGYIIDAVVYDILNGTTLSAINAASYYYNGTTSTIPNQEVETTMAINYAQYLALQVIQNKPVERVGAGTGIRVDGSLALGFLRSFVTDSFTQYNQGGKGIHIINCGYAQLVSTFTICTTEGVICESGGQCSISTSNCSFGLSGLVATGKSAFPVLTGYQVVSTPLSENYIFVYGVNPKPLSAFIDSIQKGIEIEGIPVIEPYNGLLVKVDGDPASNYNVQLNPSSLTKYHGIKAVSALPVGPYPPYSYRLTVEQNVTAPLTASNNDPKYVEFYLRSQIASSSHAFEYIGTGIDLELAVPALGGKPINDNEAVYSDNGIVYYSSTNERGDFKVGPGFTIVQEKGSVEGLAFNKSILALVTPLILSLSQ